MNNVNPIHYKIHLEPDLINFTFAGNTEILVEALKPIKKITLNSLELTLFSCKVKMDGMFLDCPFHKDQHKEDIIISFPEEMSDRINLKIDYKGELNDKMAGFYRSKYVHDGSEKYIAVTQFEESDARRAFPCFDHPVKKATFNIEMVIDEKLSAISNGPIIEQKSLSDNRKLVRFQQTPKMSTYLLFFGVGEFEFMENSGDVIFRAITMPQMTKYAKFGLEFGIKSLEFCEDYYGIKYPLPKLDLIAVPDFAAGAMENWGAITFRENLLLHYPDITSRAGEHRICEVIAHEMAHQWFGNLVTPSDWRYLWLNESFATYFGYGVVSHYYPEWEVWDQFLHSETSIALNRDALLETIPIELPGGEHVVINVSTAPIIYNKGGSVLRQIEGYIGGDNLKDGLRLYLKKYAYSCASSHNLWEAFEEVSDKPITLMMKSWIEQKGFPVVEANREEDRLVLTQRRFTCLPNNTSQEWLVPITIKIFYENGDSKEIVTLLDNKATSIAIGPNASAYKVNYGQTGFYRVKYKEERDLILLGRRILSKELPPRDRWGLQNDLYALVKSSDASISDYMNFLSNFENEDAFLPLISIADNLFNAYLVMEGKKRETVASFGKPFLERVLSSIGYEPDPNEKHTISILRDQIIWHAVLYGSKYTAEFADDKFSSIMQGKPINPDIIKSAMRTGAFFGNGKTFEWFDKKLNSSQSEHERMNILIALGSFREKSIIEKAQKYILDKVPDRNKFIPIGYLAENPYAIDYMWEWYLSNLNRLEKLHPIHYERVIEGIVPICGIERAEEVRSFFRDYMNKDKKPDDAIKLSMEKLEINLRLRRA
ncbi:MAG: M1 family metallopeptidase [Thermodesulfobacteriota bacterium]|nr:M1 family metallopeptidase [Thermodesulfobacteriota bacterium]